MRNLLLSVCLMFTSLLFGQSEDSVVYYELYWIKTVTFEDKTIEKVRIIESDPSDLYLKRENIIKRDTMGVLSYMARQVVDSLNKLRVSKGLNIITNDETYAEDEYGYAEESIFDFYGKKQIPLMITDFYYDMGDCSCVDQVISEITSHKDIMKRVLSKRNKVINVCILIDKKTNTFYTYVQVKRLFTLSYYIGD